MFFLILLETAQKDFENEGEPGEETTVIPGSETAAFKGITILLGVILSFGSTSVVSNLLSGLFVIYRRGINVGDWIEIKDHTGFVESITLLETQLRTHKNELVSIPNTQLLSSELMNYTRQGKTHCIHL